MIITVARFFLIIIITCLLSILFLYSPSKIYADQTGWVFPTQVSGGEYSNGNNVLVRDGNLATCTSCAGFINIGEFNKVNIPDTATIEKVEIRHHMSGPQTTNRFQNSSRSSVCFLSPGYTKDFVPSTFNDYIIQYTNSECNGWLNNNKAAINNGQYKVEIIRYILNGNYNVDDFSVRFTYTVATPTPTQPPTPTQTPTPTLSPSPTPTPTSTVLYSQTDDSSRSTNSTPISDDRWRTRQRLGTGLSGVINGIKVKWQKGSAGNICVSNPVYWHCPFVILYEFSDSNYTTQTNSSQYNFNSNLDYQHGTDPFTITAGIVYALNPSRYYEIVIGYSGDNNGGSIYVFGSTNNNYASGDCTSSRVDMCTPNKDIYFELLGTPIATPTPTPSPTPSASPTPAPFLDLPWDYRSQEKILGDEVLRAGSWFDHQYPLQNIFGINKVLKYTGEETDLPYRSHSGYDYNRQNGVEYRTSVLAAASGTATLKFASHSAGAGNIIKIDHPNGYQTWYEHLDPTGMIVPDENTKISVEQGQKIGETGFTGNVYPPNQDGAHIHLSVFKDLNNNNNFNDDYPFGLNDPLGWDGKYTDPWTQWTSDPPERLDKRYGAKSYKLFLSLKTPKEAPIATSGGELIDDKIKVSVPSNASFVPFILTLKYGPFESGNLLRSILPSFFLSAINNLGENISPFILPIQIIYDYADANLFNIKEETLKLYHFNEDTKIWDDLPSTIDTENKKVIASTMNFSHFALMGEIKDKIAPTTEIVINGDKGQDNWYRSTVTVNLNGEDNTEGLGLKHTLYTVNGDNWIEYAGPLTFNEDRTYTITYESSDNAYNIEDLKTASFNIDTTPPASTANITKGTKGQNDWYTTDVIIELSANDQNGSGIEKTEYSLNGSDFSPYTTPLIISNEGENELKFRSIDKAGNIEESQILKVKIDKTLPDTLLYITGTRGSESWYRTNVQVAFNAADEKSGYNTTYYSLDEGNDKKFIEYTETPPLILSKEEITKIYYYSIDNAGNKEATRELEIKIDKTPPIVSISTTPDTIWPPNGKMIDVKISGNSTDNNSVTTTFNVEDEYNSIEPDLTDFGQTIQLEAKRNGNDVDGRVYTIQATAEDLAGNTTQRNTSITVPHDQRK